MKNRDKSKKQTEQPRHKRAKVKYKFADGSSSYTSLVDAAEQLIGQYAWMANHDDPEMRIVGRAKMREIAEFCVAGQFFLDDQKGKASEPRATIETDEGKVSIAEIIKGLAFETDSLGEPLSPAELWPRFINILRDLNLEPKETISIRGRKQEKEQIVEFWGRVKPYSASTFRAQLSKIRNSET